MICDRWLILSPFSLGKINILFKLNKNFKIFVNFALEYEYELEYLRIILTLRYKYSITYIRFYDRVSKGIYAQVVYPHGHVGMSSYTALITRSEVFTKSWPKSTIGVVLRNGLIPNLSALFTSLVMSPAAAKKSSHYDQILALHAGKYEQSIII